MPQERERTVSVSRILFIYCVGILIADYMSMKAQSAMEYLMTYSWAILVIAVVVSALSLLGIFNMNLWSPRASPGSCQVYRPAGPWSTSLISLTGLCTGQQPQYTAVFSSTAMSNVIMEASFNGISQAVTITAWVYPTSVSSEQGIIWREAPAGGSNRQFGLAISNTGKILWEVSTGGTSWDGSYVSVNAIQANTWSFVAASWDGSTQTIYIDGAPDSYNTATGIFAPSNAAFDLGAERTNTNYFNGKMADVQMYNDSLSSNEIQAIYIEGIGGAPLVLRTLAGWWTLNGNTNDYSGDNVTTSSNDISFSTSWYTGYTQP